MSWINVFVITDATTWNNSVVSYLLKKITKNPFISILHLSLLESTFHNLGLQLLFLLVWVLLVYLTRDLSQEIEMYQQVVGKVNMKKEIPQVKFLLTTMKLQIEKLCGVLIVFCLFWTEESDPFQLKQFYYSMKPTYKWIQLFPKIIWWFVSICHYWKTVWLLLVRRL